MNVKIEEAELFKHLWEKDGIKINSFTVKLALTKDKQILPRTAWYIPLSSSLEGFQQPFFRQRHSWTTVCPPDCGAKTLKYSSIPPWLFLKHAWRRFHAKNGDVASNMAWLRLRRYVSCQNFLSWQHCILPTNVDCLLRLTFIINSKYFPSSDWLKAHVSFTMTSYWWPNFKEFWISRRNDIKSASLCRLMHC